MAIHHVEPEALAAGKSQRGRKKKECGRTLTQTDIEPGEPEPEALSLDSQETKVGRKVTNKNAQ
jgi:hypothetical protein